MRSVYKPNISATGRLASTIGGAALAVAGYQRSSRAFELLGLGLIARGASGWCPVTAVVDRDSKHHNETTRGRPGGARGVTVESVTTVNRPIGQVFDYWRNFENLPRFMEHLEEVRVLDRSLSRWVAKGPLGVRVEWAAEIINDIPPKLLSWKSVGASDVVTAGSVRFKAVGDHATNVHVRLQYNPPGGKVGATAAWLIGDDPQHQIAEDLRRFKELLEGGDVSSESHTPTASSSQRVRRDLDLSELTGDFGSTR